MILLTANSPAFANVLAEPGARADKVRRQSRHIRRGHAPPARISRRSIPNSIGEACFIDADGEEFARVVRGQVAPAKRPLDRRGADRLLYADVRASASAQVHQTRPYVSPDTNEWVVANATLIPQPDGRKRAFVHFEVTVESFRRAMGAEGDRGATCA